MVKEIEKEQFARYVRRKLVCVTETKGRAIYKKGIENNIKPDGD